MDQSSVLFLDANILIEIILGRDHSEAAVKLIENHPGQPAISTLTGHLVMYFGGRISTTRLLQGFLADFDMLPLEKTDFDWAFANLHGDDFEDALQLAIAIRNGYDKFLTLDKKLYNAYKNLEAISVQLLV